MKIEKIFVVLVLNGCETFLKSIELVMMNDDEISRKNNVMFLPIVKFS